MALTNKQNLSEIIEQLGSIERTQENINLVTARALFEDDFKRLTVRERQALMDFTGRPFFCEADLGWFIKQNDISDVVPEFERLKAYFRILPDNSVAFINRLAFTYAIHIVAHNFNDGYTYRFCFPSLGDAIKALEELQSYEDVPTFGWVAARPENRLLLPNNLISYSYASTGKAKEFLQESIGAYCRRVDLLAIDGLIEDGFYTAQGLKDYWIKNEIKPDSGAVKFYEYLKNREEQC